MKRRVTSQATRKRRRDGTVKSLYTSNEENAAAMGGQRRVTVRDIAAETGLSIATVSRALNGHRTVTPPPRPRVNEAAERLRARIGVSGKPKGSTVFVRCPYVLTDYFGLIVS